MGRKRKEATLEAAKHPDVGERLRKAREATGLTQSELARRISVSTQAVSQAEGGKNLPSWPYMVELSNLSGVDLRWIITGASPSEESAVRAAGGGYDVPIINIEGVRDLDAATRESTRMHRANFPNGERSFALTVNDRSNEPDLKIGDICIFDPEARKEPGKFVLALIGKGREPVIRRLQERETGYVLVPSNAAWAPKVITSTRDGEIVAVMVEYTRRT